LFIDRDEPILAKSWSGLNVTLFGERNASEDIAIDSLTLKYATGYVAGTVESLFCQQSYLIKQIYLK